WVALLPLTTLAFLRIERPRRRAARALALASGFALYLFAGANVEGLALFRGTNALLEQHLALVRNYKNVSDATLTNSLFAVPAGLALMRGTRDPDPDRIRELIARLDAAHEGPFR
ncbi:MAG TPA: hypothetical protein VKG44_05275, partial [Candidatus Baltobacteraceae bacterium]|nr:hypothetical protein [Candidatus Baltobacteraceae bacterium]